jgi:hypothetical protein
MEVGTSMSYGHIRPFFVQRYLKQWHSLKIFVPVHTTTHCRFYREQQWTQHLLRPALHQDVLFFFWFLTDFNEVQKESTRKSSMNAIVLDIFERKMDECVHRTWMFPLPSKVNRGITPSIAVLCKTYSVLLCVLEQSVVLSGYSGFFHH